MKTAPSPKPKVVKPPRKQRLSASLPDANHPFFRQKAAEAAAFLTTIPLD
jgi:hypothetical protein